MDCSTTLQLNKAINACARGERWVEALQLFRGTWCKHRRDAISYNSTANACVKGEQWQLALLLFGELPESERTVISYNIAMKAFEKASAWLQSLDLLHQMRLHDIKTDIISCNTAVSACGKNSQWQLAVAMALWNPDLVGINAAIDACSSASEWEHSLCLLSCFPACRLQRDVISFTSALSACEKGTQWPLVLLLQQMKEEHLEGNVMTYNSCISSLSKGSEWTAAQRLFDRLLSSSCGCTVTSYGSAIGGVWPQAMLLMKSMGSKQVRSNLVIYNSCVSCADAAWNWALQLLEDMEVSNFRRSSATIGAVLQALKMVPGQWPAALELMPGRSLQNTIIYNSAITVCAQGHEVSVAWKLFEEMQGVSLRCDAITFTGVMVGAHWSSAVQLLERGRSAKACDLKMWSAVLSACEAMSHWSQALHALQMADRGGFQCDDTAYSIVISACKRAVMGNLT